MASIHMTVYTRIRLPSAVDIVELAAMFAEGKGNAMLDWFHDFVDVSMKPFDDDVPCITPEQLKELVDCVKIERR